MKINSSSHSANHLNIVTSGRLGQEFAYFANSIKGVNCTFVDNLTDVTPYDAYAGFGDDLQHVDISNLDWIHSFGAGIDSFTYHPKLSQDTLISRTKGYLGSKIAEYCLTYLLFSLKGVEQAKFNQKIKVWKKINTHDLSDQNILIYGTGNIGASIAKMFTPLVNSVVGFSLSGKQKDHFSKVYKDDLPAAELQRNDVIINTLPLTSDTANFFDTKLFSLFKDILFINVGRGRSVVTEDLEGAIDNGNVKFAILDVFPIEPLSDSSPLWNNQKVIITPHNSGVTSIEDVKSSFNLALTHFLKNQKNSIFTSLTKGY